MNTGNTRIAFLKVTHYHNKKVNNLLNRFESAKCLSVKTDPTVIVCKQ